MAACIVTIRCYKLLHGGCALNTIQQILVSKLPGVVCDCDIVTGAKIGGGTATDNTVPINKFLASARVDNPIHLIFDGCVSVRGLNLVTQGYVKLSGLGWRTGVFVASGSNADAISNGHILPFNPGIAAPTPTGYVQISDFRINGNRGDGTTGNVNTGNPRGITGTYWYTNIHLWNLAAVSISNMFIYDSPAYGVLLDNCSDIAVWGSTIHNPVATGGFNGDCLHINGPAADVRVLGNLFDNALSDDGIAFNAAEGYGGRISRAIITGNTFRGTSTAMRAYGGIIAGSTTTGSLDSVIFSNNTGSVGNAVIVLGGSPTPSGDNEGPRIFIASGNSFSCVTYAIIGGSSGDFTFSDCVWWSPTNDNGSWIAPGLAGTISSITMNNCRVYRDTDGASIHTPLLSSSFTVTIKRLTINGYAVIDEEGQSYSPVANLLQMTNITIDDLYIASLNMKNITALADSYANITAISGPGLFPVKGKSTLVAGTVTVSSPFVRTGAVIQLTNGAPSATIGVLSVGAIVDKTSFVINSTSDQDASTINWTIQ